MSVCLASPSCATVVFRSRTVPRLPGLLNYFNVVGSDFCPLLWPSRKRSLIRNSVYELSGDEAGLSETMFYLGLLHTETLRRSRRLARSADQALMCENLFFRFASEDVADGPGLFDWPHWLLKKHFTGLGIMYGKFWKGEMQVSAKGADIPPPPYHMLSVRSASKPRDPKFFTKAPELLSNLLSADDNGRHPLEDAGLGQNFFDHALTEDGTPEQILRAMQASRAYQKLLVSARAERKRQ